MSDITRRNFLCGLGLLAAGTHPAIANAMMGAAPRLVNPSVPDLKGKLIGTSFLHDDKSCIFEFDLSHGTLKQSEFVMEYAHDALRMGDDYIVMPKSDEAIIVTNFDGERKLLDLPKPRMAYSGHALYDDERKLVIATAYDRDEGMKGYFVLIDPVDYTIRDIVPDGSYNAHDICFLDKDTIALCAYNFRHPYDKYDLGLKFRPEDGQSVLILYDRATLKPKQTIQAFKDALVTHLVTTKDKEIFAIGQQNYADNDMKNRSQEYWAGVVRDYINDHQPSLKGDIEGYINAFKVHRVEYAEKGVGMPLQNVVLPYGGKEVELITQNPQHHRRPQSICYSPDTNTVAISYPHTDGIVMIDAKTRAVRSLGLKETGLAEVRGITPVDGTPYLVAAGHKGGLSVIDARDGKVVNSIDAPIGRTIHMHYSAT